MTEFAPSSLPHSRPSTVKTLGLVRVLLQRTAIYFKMTKPTISFLVVISALPTTLLLSQNIPPISFIAITCAGIFLMSASAAICNQLLEWKIDQTMHRTRKRSLPSGQTSRAEALVLALVFLTLGFYILASHIRPLVAYIGLIGHVYYVILYTLILKPRTAQNIVIGGAAGAVGPLMGAAAVEQLFSFEAWILFAFIFLWTPPHFWSLSLKYQKDYAAAGIPMYPIVYGEQRTRNMIRIYSILLLPVVCSFFWTGLWMSSIITLGMTLYLIALSWKLCKDKNNSHAMPLFHFSCIYALCVFSALTLEKIVLLTYAG